MAMTFSDWAPVVVAAVAAASGLFSLWLAVRQAHAPDKRRRKQEPQAGE